MSGRGRGRGRGRTPPSVIQDIIRPELFPDIKLHSSGDNKLLQLIEEQKQQQLSQQQNQELQPTDANNNVKVETAEDDASSALINSMLLSQKKISSNKRSAQTLFLITKGREIHHRIQNSAFHVKATKDVPDIIRYSDSKKAPPITDASTVLSHCLRGKKRTAMGQFVPEELVSGQKSGSSREISRGRAASLTDLEASKDLTRPMVDSNDNVEGVTGVDEEEYEDQGSEDEAEDYVADYYASEGDESDGDNDKEATF